MLKKGKLKRCMCVKIERTQKIFQLRQRGKTEAWRQPAHWTHTQTLYPQVSAPGPALPSQRPACKESQNKPP